MGKKFVFDAQIPAGAGEGPTIDFEGLSQYVVDTVGCSEKPEAMIGIVSGVIDLGLQAQEDAKMKWEGTDQDKADIEAKAARGESKEYFEVVPHGQNNVPTLCKRWPVKAQRCVALNIDFPDVILNRGKFFEEDGVGEDLPFRAPLNNEFGLKGVGKVVGKPYSLKEQRNEDGTWGLKNNTILWKLAQATNQLDSTVNKPHGNFKPGMLGNLIGEAAMFNVHVTLNQVGEKKYLNEKLSFNGPVPKAMQKLIPVLDERFMHVVNFKGEQDLEVLKTLRQSVINTMKMAEDFEGSDVQKALIEIGKVKAGEGGAAPTESKPTPQQAKPEAKQADPIDFDSFDEDLPF